MPLFKRRKKKSPVSPTGALGESIRDAEVGDVFTMDGLEYEDSYFIIESKSRYESPFGKSYELLGVDGENKLTVQWSGDVDLFVTVSADSKPIGLAKLGLSDDDIVRMDEEQSVDNHVAFEGSRHVYKYSCEAFYFPNNTGDGQGFYLWEFWEEGNGKVLSVVKWEGMPFQVYVSDRVPPDSITVYKR